MQHTKSGGPQNGGAHNGGTRTGERQSGGTRSGGTRSGGPQNGEPENDGAQSGGAETGGTRSNGAQSAAGLNDIDFILWPEAAYPYLTPVGAGQLKSASSLVRRLNTPLITGAVRKKKKGFGNSLIALNRRGRIEYPIYDKSILIAFGEYMPSIFNHSFIRKRLSYFAGAFTPGPGPQV